MVHYPHYHLLYCHSTPVLRYIWIMRMVYGVSWCHVSTAGLCVRHGYSPGNKTENNYTSLRHAGEFRLLQHLPLQALTVLCFAPLPDELTQVYCSSLSAA